MPTDELRHGLHGHVGPERQWTLIKGRCESVIHTEVCAVPRRWCLSQLPSAVGLKVTPPKSSRPRCTSRPNTRIGHGESMHRPSAPALASFGESRDTLVTLIGQGNDRSCRQLIEYCCDPRHAGCERDRRATFQTTDDLFQCLPTRRAVIPSVCAVRS